MLQFQHCVVLARRIAFHSVVMDIHIQSFQHNLLQDQDDQRFQQDVRGQLFHVALARVLQISCHIRVLHQLLQQPSFHILDIQRQFCRHTSSMVRMGSNTWNMNIARICFCRSLSQEVSTGSAAEASGWEPSIRTYTKSTRPLILAVVRICFRSWFWRTENNSD